MTVRWIAKYRYVVMVVYALMRYAVKFLLEIEKRKPFARGQIENVRFQSQAKGVWLIMCADMNRK